MTQAKLEDERLFPRWVHVMLPVAAKGRFDIWTGMLGSMKLRVDTRADTLEKLMKEQQEQQQKMQQQLDAVLEKLGHSVVPKGKAKVNGAEQSESAVE